MLSMPLFGQYYVRGEHNAWGTAGGELTVKTGLGGDSYYGITIAVNDLDEFKIANDDWSNQWAGIAVSAYDAINTLSWYGTNASWVSPPQSYVHISVKDPANYIGVDLPVGIMALSSSVLTEISSVSDDHSATPSENETVTVTLTTSQTLLSEEKLFVRYTEDNWATSQAVQASGSGTSYTAEIVSSINDTIRYYALTSTLDWNTSSVFRDNPDLMTINYNTNSSQNYEYVVESNSNSAPVIASVGNQTVSEGNTLVLTITATDADDDPLKWSASGFGTGIDTATVNGDFTLTFTPDYTEAGRVDTITVTVSDGISESSSSIIVNDKNKNSSR